MYICEKDKFVFYVENPREKPSIASTELIGWLTATEEIKKIILLRKECEQELVLKSDSQLLYIGHSHLVRFHDQIFVGDLWSGCVRFSFFIGDTQYSIEVPLADPPTPLGDLARQRVLSEIAAAESRLRRTIASGRHLPPKEIWNAETQLAIAKAKLIRGETLGKTEGEMLLGIFARIFPQATVLQIGANDGVTEDPLIRWIDQTRWQILMVEPISHLARELRRLYQENTRVTVAEVAISEADGAANIYRLAESPGTPKWYQALATFDRSVLLKHRNPITDIDDRIIEEKVTTVTVSSLHARYGLSDPQLVVIDTEGHDFKVLRQFNMRVSRPTMIIFEHIHLSAKEKEGAYQFLRKHDYQWIEAHEGDCYAWRKFQQFD